MSNDSNEPPGTGKAPEPKTAEQKIDHVLEALKSNFPLGTAQK